MAMKGEGILALWLDVVPEMRDECDEWYVREHIPERIDLPGFRRARRYAALTGAPGYLAVYEADRAETLLEPGYRQISGNPTEWTRRMRPALRNTVRSTLRVTASRGRGEGSVLGCVRLSPAAGRAAALRGWMVDDLLPALLRQHCIAGTHLWENDPAVRATMDATRKAGAEDPSADWVLLFEATQPDEVEAAHGALLAEGQLVAHGAAPGEVFGIYRLLYTVSDYGRAAMTMKGKGILGMWIDLLPETVDECDDWHIREHIPERIDVPGFNRARRYIALEGTPRYHAVYETDTIETLASPAYTDITAKPTDWAMRMRKDYRNAHRGVFRVTGTVGRGFGGCIASIRFAPAEGKADGLRRWITGELLPALVEQRCVLGVHLWESDPALRAELTAKRAAGRDDKVVDWVLMVEATQRREIEDACKVLLPGDTLARHGAQPGHALGIYQFLFGMTE